MRRLWLPALLAAALLLAGRAGGDEPPAWPQRLVYAAGIVPRGLNPLLDRAGWNEISSVLLSRLFRPDHNGGIEGDLVESYTVSDGGRRYELKLRPNVVWHDGRPFTADDVLFTWQRLFDPQTETTLDLNQAALVSFRKAGRHTFVFELRAPDSGFLAALTEIAVLPAHRLRGKNINGDAFDREPVGTGPYKLARREGAGTFHFTRHERHHYGRPAFEELVIEVIADDDARARAVAEGRADVGHVKPPHVAMLEARGRRVLRMRTGAWRGMPLNLARPALADARVRQAMDLAMDREAIVREALQGYGEAGYSPIPPASWAFRAEMNRKRYDPQRAAQLLDAAG
jgi:peptide/nickel transport system substrate-binding protein